MDKIKAKPKKRSTWKCGRRSQRKKKKMKEGEKSPCIIVPIMSKVITFFKALRLMKKL